MSGTDPLYYLDTSALLPYYRDEPVTGRVHTFLADQTQPMRVTLLTEVEMASALARIVRVGELNQAHASQISELFEKERRAGLFRRVPITQSHYERAKTWLNLRTTLLRTLDALHLACCEGIGAEMVTADRDFHTAATELGVPCRLLTASASNR